MLLWKDRRYVKYIFITFIIVSLSFSIYSYFSIPEDEIDPNSRTYKASSVLGCLQLRGEYTPEQWEAKQNFRQKVFGYKLSECE